MYVTVCVYNLMRDICLKFTQKLFKKDDNFKKQTKLLFKCEVKGVEDKNENQSQIK